MATRMSENSTLVSEQESVAERHVGGKALRQEAPRSSHAGWSPPSGRFDPVELLEQQNEDRLPWLVPVRRSRMVESPFAFYRAAARTMATDLAGTPVTGLTVQACGDAHLANFGTYASPERRLVFDINDFDETLAGPWEWDVKRLATSFTIAAQHREFDTKTCRHITRLAVKHYREAMAEFAQMRTLGLWYEHLPLDDLLRQDLSKKDRRRILRFASKARSKDSLQAESKLAEITSDGYRIRSDAPVLLPLRDLPDGTLPAAIDDVIRDAFEDYKSSLHDNRKRLLEQFSFVDAALKVVGVGSVGTRCFVALFQGRDQQDPLFLQIKEAGPSVLEEHLPASPYKHHGQRVVEGQRLMQAVSDIFLGWAQSEYTGRTFYWRQLKDWKGSADLDTISASRLRFYAYLCGWTLARSHARTGDPVAIAGYLGSGESFDEAVTSFAEDYAEQNHRDHAAFKAAIEDGRLATDDEK